MITSDDLEALRVLVADIGTQDNRCTAAPIYVVQQRRREYGYDAEFAEGDNVAWLDNDADYCEADAEEHARLEAQYSETLETPDGWTRTVFKDFWDPVQPFLTERAAREYLEANAHRLRQEARIYVDSAHRNREWLLLRRTLPDLVGIAVKELEQCQP